MADFNSVQISSIESTDISNAPLQSAIVNKSRGYINLLTEPALNDVIHLADIPSSAYVSNILMINEDLDSGSGVIIDLGIYAAVDFRDSTGSLILKNSVLNMDAFETAGRALRANNTVSPEVLRWNILNSTGGPEGYDKTLWELAGLSLDPFVDLRISITITTAFDTFVPGQILTIFEWEGKT